jgi:hypothetical protein
MTRADLRIVREAPFPKQPPELIPEKHNVASTTIVTVATDTHTFDFDIQP